MDFAGHVRVGTNLPDKKVYMNMRRLVAEIQSKNGDRPINDADREAIAEELGVKVSVVERMETRVFAHTDSLSEDGEDRMVSSAGVIAVPGEQGDVERETDQTGMMQKIWAIVENNYEERDLEIVQTRLAGDMTREKFDELVEKHGISVERIRQIQRAALLTIREGLQSEGITGMGVISV